METMHKRLNLTLDINSDEELRSYIKQIIDGQVKSIVREEFREILKSKVVDMISNKKEYSNIISRAMNSAVEQEVRNSIRIMIEEKKPRNYFSLDGYIKNNVDEKINSAIEDVLTKVDIENIIRTRSEKIVEQLFDNMIKNKQK